MQVARLGCYKEPSPYNNFSILQGRGEHINGSEDFDYVLEVPGEEYPILLTEYGFRTTVCEMRRLSERVGRFRITPLTDELLPFPRGYKPPNTTLTVDELINEKAKLRKLIEVN